MCEQNKLSIEESIEWPLCQESRGHPVLRTESIQTIFRCVPLLGVSLEAAQELHWRAVRIVVVKQPGATPLNKRRQEKG